MASESSTSHNLYLTPEDLFAEIARNEEIAKSLAQMQASTFQLIVKETPRPAIRKPSYYYDDDDDDDDGFGVLPLTKSGRFRPRSLVLVFCRLLFYP